MPRIQKIHLSESNNGIPIKITDTATPGQLIHIAVADGMDLVSLWFTNGNTSTRTVTVEWGGSDADHRTAIVLPGQVGEVWGIVGLLLARIPEEIVVSRKEYFNMKTKGQMDAVDNDLMKEQRPEMPINIERQSRVTFGSGTKK